MKFFIHLLTAVLLMVLLCNFAASATDALDEVNARRAARGERPFVRDDSLSAAAAASADFRAELLMKGHTGNDFSALPAGSQADAAGCGASTDDWGWLTCCMDENWTYAGAAWTRGRDGKHYMHLFVSNRPNGGIVNTSNSAGKPDTWCIGTDGKVYGPFTLAQVEQYALEGRITHKWDVRSTPPSSWEILSDRFLTQQSAADWWVVFSDGRQNARSYSLKDVEALAKGHEITYAMRQDFDSWVSADCFVHHRLPARDSVYGKAEPPHFGVSSDIGPGRLQRLVGPNRPLASRSCCGTTARAAQARNSAA